MCKIISKIIEIISKLGSASGSAVVLKKGSETPDLNDSNNVRV